MCAWLSLAGVLACVVVWSAPEAGAAAAQPTTCSGVPWSSDQPCLTLTPAAGPVGTHVRVSGRLTRTQIGTWRRIINEDASDPLYGLTGAFRTGRSTCEILGGIDDLRLVAARTGVVSGSFVVSGGSAPCKQDVAGLRHAFDPGAYTLDVGCITCGVGVFTITASPLASTGTRESLDTLLVLAAASVAIGTALLGAGRRQLPAG